MVAFKKTCSVILPQISLLKRNYFCFQGHYTNRYGNISKIPSYQCQGSKTQQSTFMNFSGNNNKRREYCGRQLVGYSMNQMYEVVSDVENYHKFVPWCKKSVILKKTPGHLNADLIVGFPPVHERYTSSVTLVKPHLVKAECTDGKVFKHLLTLWRFSPGLKQETKSCVVDFQITFEFRSAFHSHLSSLFFNQVAIQMEGAFIKEVGRRNGPAKMEPRNLLVTKQSAKS